MCDGFRRQGKSVTSTAWRCSLPIRHSRQPVPSKHCCRTLLITARQRSYGKVMFSQAVCQSFCAWGGWCHFLSNCLVPCSFRVLTIESHFLTGRLIPHVHSGGGGDLHPGRSWLRKGGGTSCLAPKGFGRRGKSVTYAAWRGIESRLTSGGNLLDKTGGTSSVWNAFLLLKSQLQTRYQHAPALCGRKSHQALSCFPFSNLKTCKSNLVCFLVDS